jgi:protein-S-isoprenylcysteine O-methyltransferase Ste14
MAPIGLKLHAISFVFKSMEPLVAKIIYMIGYYFLRVPREERMMREEFGESYDKYLLGTGRILPKL